MPLAVALATAADILEAAEAEYSPPLKDALVFRWPLGPHFLRDGCFSSGVLGGGLFRGGGGGSYPRFSRAACRVYPFRFGPLYFFGAGCGAGGELG